MRTNTLIALLVSSLVVATGCSSNKELLLEKDTQISELRQKVESLETTLAKAEKRSSDLDSELQTALEEFKLKEQVLLERIDFKSVITISDAMMFSSGSLALTSTATEILDKIGEVIGRYPDREVRIEGHTDNVGIALEFQEQFKSNWELSTARATSVLHYLRRKHDISGDHLVAVGHGEHRPLSANDTPEGRSKNRRVVISIGPRL